MISTEKEINEKRTKVQIFTTEDVLHPSNSYLIHQMQKLDTIRYGKETSDPFLLGLNEGSQAFSSHVITARDGAEVIGAAALTLRSSPDESTQLASTIDVLNSKYPGCKESLEELCKMLIITNMVS